MRRVRYVLQLLAPNIGSLRQKRIRVNVYISVYIYYNCFLYLFFSFISCLFLVIQALIALVNDPEPEHPLRGDIAEEFLKDRRKFLKNAEEFTKKHAEKRRESASAE